MAQLMKMLWEFRGPHAARTAEHHAKHLAEFAEREGLTQKTSGVEAVSPFYVLAYLIVAEDELGPVREVLKPRGVVPIESDGGA